MPTLLKNPSDRLHLPALPGEARSVVFVDGRFSAEHSRLEGLPSGVEISAAPAGETESVRIILADKAVFESPLHVIFFALGENVSSDLFSPRVHVKAGASTRLNLVIHFLGHLECSRGIHSVVEAHLAENACMDYFQSEESSGEGMVRSDSHFHLNRHASIDAIIFTQGGADSRHETTVHLSQPHAFASLKGLSMLRGSKRAAHQVTLLHEAAHCISRQYYKSILADRSVAEYDSLVWVREGAAKSDSQQLNRNLLLSEEATALSKPRLRIDHDDVAATHGSASGPMSESELFYLRSRGIGTEDAKSLLIFGFAEEIVSQIQEKSLREHLEGVIGGCMR